MFYFQYNLVQVNSFIGLEFFFFVNKLKIRKQVFSMQVTFIYVVLRKKLEKQRASLENEVPINLPVFNSTTTFHRCYTIKPNSLWLIIVRHDKSIVAVVKRWCTINNNKLISYMKHKVKTWNFVLKFCNNLILQKLTKRL